MSNPLVIGDNRDSLHDPGVLVPIQTRPTPFLTERGPNGKLVYRANPISWLVDVFGCIPFLNFNGSSSQASQDAAAQVAASPGATPNTLPAATVQDNPYADLFGLAPAAAPAPTSNPSQVGSFGNPSTQAAAPAAPHAAAPTGNRQYQLITSNPIYGPWNPAHSAEQNRQQIQQAQQALGVQPYPTLPGGR